MLRGLRIRDAHGQDAGAIADLQNALLYEQAVEWSDTPHTPENRLDWLALQAARGFPVLVAELSGVVVAWASYGDFRDSSRWPGYRFTVEHTLHVHRELWGQGIGRLLLESLVERAREVGMHVMVGAIDADNPGSLAFHRRTGFTEVGRMPEVGFKLGRWRTLVLVQRLLRGGGTVIDAEPPDTR